MDFVRTKIYLRRGNIFYPERIGNRGVVDVKDHAFFYPFHPDGWISGTLVNYTDPDLL